MATDRWTSREGIRGALARLGHRSLTAFARGRPTATFPELAEEASGLTGTRVAPIDIKRLILQEAGSDGELTVTAMDALRRILLQMLPDGWRHDEGGVFPRSHAFAVWVAFLPPPYEKQCWRVWERLSKADVPAGWRPVEPDDPILAAAFAGEVFRLPD